VSPSRALRIAKVRDLESVAESCHIVLDLEVSIQDASNGPCSRVVVDAVGDDVTAIACDIVVVCDVEALGKRELFNFPPVLCTLDCLVAKLGGVLKANEAGVAVEA